jgi:Ca2+-transporting ATPase
MALQGGVSIHRVRRRYPRLSIRHRTELKPYVTTVHRSGSRGRLMVVKGNPAAVMDMCTRVRVGGRIRVLDDQTRAAILGENEEWTGSESYRVLGVAYDRYGQDEPPHPDELIWLGLVGLQDPLRHGMKDLISELHTAGIETIMITGDQMSTAAAVGRQLALSGDKTLRVLDSRDLSRLDHDVLEALVRQTHIYARVSPANKLEIVQAMQRGGRVVAMTGDGINDGPALKAADVGIAMGQADNDVARSVADIVVDEDRLQSVIAALGQGRSIYSNVRAAIHYLVSTNLSEIELMLAAAALGLGMPLTPMQLLWINLATDALPAIALGLEPPKSNVLKDPPRDPTEPIIQRQRLAAMFRESTLMTGGALLSLLLGRVRGGSTAVAGTMAFNSLLVAQLLHAFTCRPGRPRGDMHALVTGNRTLAVAVIASLGIQAVGLGVPMARRFLGAAALRAPDLLISLATALGAFALNEFLHNRENPVARSSEDE